MRRIFLSLVLIQLLAATASVAAAATERFIVVFEDGPAGRTAVRNTALRVHLELPEIDAVAVEMTRKAARALADVPGIALVEPDPPRSLMAQTVPYGIDLVQATTMAAGPDPVSVCVMDTGYDLGHRDLPKGMVDGFGSDWNQDDCGHGTHVAGTIAARDNRKGVVGTAPGVALYIVKVFTGCETTTSASKVIAAAFRCRDAGAKVINMSLGCSGKGCRSATEEAAFAELFEDGILSVAAAGNDGNKKQSYPASYGSVVSVAALDSDRKHASFSQRNGKVELAAPGDGVFSTLPRGFGYNMQLSVGGTGHDGIPMEGSPNRTGRGPLVDCGLADATCPGVGGHVCLIERGEITFASKVQACEAGGGRGAIIYNHSAGPLFGTLGETETSIPSVGITRTAGLAMLDQLGLNARVKTKSPGHYGHLSGTSMATPHVAGVAALLWTHNASWTPDEIRAALRETAEDLGAPGRDKKFGFGLVSAPDALAALLDD